MKMIVRSADLDEDEEVWNIIVKNNADLDTILILLSGGERDASECNACSPHLEMWIPGWGIRHYTYGRKSGSTSSSRVGLKFRASRCRKCISRIICHRARIGWHWHRRSERANPIPEASIRFLRDVKKEDFNKIFGQSFKTPVQKWFILTDMLDFYENRTLDSREGVIKHAMLRHSYVYFWTM